LDELLKKGIVNHEMERNNTGSILKKMINDPEFKVLLAEEI